MDWRISNDGLNNLKRRELAYRMKKNIWAIATMLVLWGVLESCRSARKLQGVMAPQDSSVAVIKEEIKKDDFDSAAFLASAYRGVMANRIEFQSFSAKTKVDFTGADGKKNELNAFIRVKKDSAIWISINAALGIEVFRVLITPDSVKVLDKLNKTFKQNSLSSLQEITRIPFSFSDIQDILLGNPVFLDSNLQRFSLNGDQLSLYHQGSWYSNSLTVSAGNFLMLSSKVDDRDLSRNRTCLLVYGNYDQRDGRAFSTFRNLTLAEQSKIDIRIEFKQYAFNEVLSFPFSIPRNYSRN